MSDGARFVHSLWTNRALRAAGVVCSVHESSVLADFGVPAGFWVLVDFRIPVDCGSPAAPTWLPPLL